MTFLIHDFLNLTGWSAELFVRVPLGHDDNAALTVDA